MKGYQKILAIQKEPKFAKGGGGDEAKP
jgi:hypothetical protein